MFGWFRSTGELIWENILSSAELFERSIYVSDCKPEHSYEVWHDNACAALPRTLFLLRASSHIAIIFQAAGSFLNTSLGYRM